ncbi:Sulfiredoxin-1 [Halotydeus destructor]|nr:Sulfiredoxin-1 [Halotydeus destructor]
MRINCRPLIQSLFGRQFFTMAVNKSVHAGNIQEVHDVPFKVLIRPFQSELDEDKVQSLMDSLSGKSKSSEIIPPIDVLWVKGSNGGDYYYSFGGCHRYEAHKRLKLATVKCKLVESTISDLKHYLGSSTPDLK